MAAPRFYEETDLLNFEALNKLADNLCWLVQSKMNLTKAEVIAIEKERSRLRHIFIKMARELEGKFALIKRTLAKTQIDCKPYEQVEQEKDKSGVSLMNGDQLLQRSRHLHRVMVTAEAAGENLSRFKREFRRLVSRYQVLAKKSLFSSKTLKHTLRDCLLDISEKLAKFD